MEHYVSSKFNVCVSIPSGALAANTLTGNVEMLDATEMRLLKEGIAAEADNPTVAPLVELGFLCTPGEDESIANNALLAAKEDLSSATVTVACTMGCNFRCPYCWQEHRATPMSDDVVQMVVERIGEVVSALVPDSETPPQLSLCFTGGEPTLAPSVIEAIVPAVTSMCAGKGVRLRTSMITNGYLLNSELASRLAAISPSWLVQVTLDGSLTTHDARRKLADGGPTYSTIVSNILALDPSIFEVKVRVNVDKSNIGNAHLATRPLKDLTNVSWYAAPVTIEEAQNASQKSSCFRCPSEYGTMYSSMVELGLVDATVEGLLAKGATCCADAPLSFAVDPEGFLYKCFDDMGNPAKAFSRLGEKWVCEENLRPFAERNALNEPECDSCSVYPLCFGSCQRQWRDSGTHYCRASRFLLEDALRRIAAMRTSCD